MDDHEPSDHDLGQSPEAPEISQSTFLVDEESSSLETRSGGSRKVEEILGSDYSVSKAVIWLRLSMLVVLLLSVSYSSGAVLGGINFDG